MKTFGGARSLNSTIFLPQSINIIYSIIFSVNMTIEQCDQIGRFIGLGQLFKAFATINLHKSPTFLGIFCKGVKIYHFSSEIIFRQLL